MNLNAEKIAYDYLDTYDEEYATSKMDPMMVPFKELLTENGYITLHSCSAHVKVESFYKKIFGEKLERLFYKKNRWYILFVAVNDISKIENVVENIYKKYGYDMQLEEEKNHPKAINAWLLEYRIKESYNYQGLYTINKNIYMEFKKEFEK